MASRALTAGAAAATGLALAWAVAASIDAVLAAPEIGERALLAERRVAALVPPLLCLCCVAVVRGGPRSARLALVFAGFAGAWASWGLIVRCAHGGAGLLDALHAAWHERVLLPAVALAAIAAARAAEDRRSGETHTSPGGGALADPGAFASREQGF